MGVFASKIVNSLFYVRNLVFRPKTAESRHLIIQVEQGKLRGKDSKAAFTKKKYCSFLGVPYAKPPVGDLRFMPPQPLEPWKGIYDATYERDICCQKDPFLYLIMGSENCLHMNIFTPRPPSEIMKPLPVMVFIHGGGFIFGSSSRKYYGADLFINHDIILAAMNYRLHVLGFLNLGISECPGNVGMKDQVAALKWIKKNIDKFGGDPNNITLFGESAGASSVHYHLLSPLSQGLFHKAIMQSGLLFTEWAFTSNPIEVAFMLARKSGFLGIDRHKLVEHLKKLSGFDLVRLSEDVMDVLLHRYPTRIAKMSPSIEYIAEGAFLPDHPNKLIKLAKPISTILGYNDREGLLLYKVLGRGLMDMVGRDFTTFLKDHFKIDQNLLPEVAEDIKTLYFKNEEISAFSGDEVVNMFTDMFFYRFYEAVEHQVKSGVPTYVYQFNFSGRLNFMKTFVKLTHLDTSLQSKFEGACHGDDLFYMFYAKMLLIYPKLTIREKTVIKHLTGMWVNFAYTGNPSTEEVQWNTTTIQNPCYLRINDKPEMVAGKITEERINKLHEIMDSVAEVI